MTSVVMMDFDQKDTPNTLFDREQSQEQEEYYKNIHEE